MPKGGKHAAPAKPVTDLPVEPAAWSVIAILIGLTMIGLAVAAALYAHATWVK